MTWEVFRKKFIFKRLFKKRLRLYYKVLIKTIINNYNDIDEYRTINWSKFGVYTTNKGSTSKILDAYLSGIEVRITLEIMKIENCDDCVC